MDEHNENAQLTVTESKEVTTRGGNAVTSVLKATAAAAVVGAGGYATYAYWPAIKTALLALVPWGTIAYEAVKTFLTTYGNLVGCVVGVPTIVIALLLGLVGKMEHERRAGANSKPLGKKIRGILILAALGTIYGIAAGLLSFVFGGFAITSAMMVLADDSDEDAPPRIGAK